MQAQLIGRVKEYRLSHIILGAVVGLGLIVASVVGIQALTDGQPAAETEEVREVNSLTVAGPDTTTLNLDRYGADVEPASLARPASGVDTTTLRLDRDGADVESATDLQPAGGADTTTLTLDRDGADVPTGR